MRIIGLCDYSIKALQIWKGLKNIKSIDLYLLICNNSESKIAYFLLKQIFHFLRMDFKDKSLFTSFLFSGRFKISFYDVHSRKNLSWIKHKNPDIGLHNMGIIYRKSLISLFKLGILNPHIGQLPQYRGRSVMEWSILDNSPTGITTFFVDEGIDTGENMVFTEKVDISQFNNITSAKNYLFSLNAKMFKEAVGLLQQKNHRFTENSIKQGKRYYVMSELFKDVVEKILKIKCNQETI